MKGVIFDLDGTMVDNMLVHHQAWQRLLRSLGLELTLQQVKEQIHGVNDEIFLRLFGDRYTAEERRVLADRKEAEYREIFKPQLSLINGLPAFLDNLQQSGMLMGIGSAAPRENVDFVLDNLGIRHYFKTVLHAGDVNRGKPDPEIYHKVALGLGVEATECIIFEDSPTGAEAAWRAGSKAVILTTTHAEPEFARFPNIIKFLKDYSNTKELITSW
ncbi:MAG TPA: HAD family phosphatase [Cyclobacteriaceae bacterium]|nr:HAD family phosphatase [Cyclobacteriaceae bacterium]